VRRRRPAAFGIVQNREKWPEIWRKFGELHKKKKRAAPAAPARRLYHSCGHLSIGKIDKDEESRLCILHNRQSPTERKGKERKKVVECTGVEPA